jgi:hypothetical protein
MKSLGRWLSDIRSVLSDDINGSVIVKLGACNRRVSNSLLFEIDVTINSVPLQNCRRIKVRTIAREAEMD